MFGSKMPIGVSPTVDGNWSPNEDDAIWRFMTLLERIDEDQAVVLFNWKPTPAALEKPTISNDRVPTAAMNGHVPHEKARLDKKLERYLRLYFSKMLGTNQKRPPRDSIKEIVLCFFESFISIAILAAIDFYFLLDTQFTSIIPAFAAMAVILFTEIGSKGVLAQPRNAFFGHVLSAIVGVAFRTLSSPELMWLSAPLAVAITIALMSLTHTVHPAAGATALACVYGGPRITDSGWWFVLMPVTAGSIFILIVTLLMNNLSPRRRYPQYWY